MTHFFGTDKSIFKIVIVGDPRVGKTSIRRRYMGEGFSQSYIHTIGADFAIKVMDNRVIQIWDLAGHPIFQNIRIDFYRGAEAALLVFDLTRPETLKNVPTWVDELFKIIKRSIPLLLVGNKCDLKANGEEVVTDEDIDLCKQELRKRAHFDINYIETSALTGENIDSAFDKLLTEIEKSLTE
ncbi:MAG: Rab family GTPase [Candidatus Kariarchaeaceae archaeon]|jgi:Ras-related protein Rab-1A